MAREMLRQGQSFPEINYKTATIEELSRRTDDAFTRGVDVYNETNRRNKSLFHLYSAVAGQIPKYISSEANEKALEAISSGDPEKFRMGKEVLTALNLKTILVALEPHLTDNIDFNNDLMQDVLAEVNEHAESFHDRWIITTQIHRAAQQAAQNFVARDLRVPSTWVDWGIHKDFVQNANNLFTVYPHGLDKEKIKENSTKIAEYFGISEVSVTRYIEERNNQSFPDNPPLKTEEATMFDRVQCTMQLEELDKMVENLSARERYVIKARFFEEKTLEEIGQELGISRERVRKNEIIAIRRMSQAPNLENFPYLSETGEDRKRFNLSRLFCRDNQCQQRRAR